MDQALAHDYTATWARNTMGLFAGASGVAGSSDRSWLGLSALRTSPALPLPFADAYNTVGVSVSIP
jgi:hypothetical protein